MKDVYVNGDRIRLDPSMFLGKGGEADVWNLGGGKVLKVFKTPDHPDVAGDPNAQAAAEARINEHQKKLKAFPKGLPSTVIAPIDLATDRTGNRVAGYTMSFLKGDELIRFTQRSFRQGMSPGRIRTVFRSLHGTVSGVHGLAVIGDFNDLNVMIAGDVANLVDADSMQFGGFFCRVFTDRFVDPRHCDPKGTRPMLVRPHDADSDWYAYAVMLFQCLLFVDPYGGIFKPKDAKKNVPQTARPLHRITVFNPEVRYPKPATPYKVLPDELMQRFHLVFEKDERGAFPLALIEAIEWTTCPDCKLEHARKHCPDCVTAPPAAVKQTVMIRGKVTATRIFKTHGVILRAAWQNGKLLWLYHENDRFIRENATEALKGKLAPGVRYRIRGGATLLGKDGRLITLEPGKPNRVQAIDMMNRLPVFDANEKHAFWTTSGRLERENDIAPEHVGDVLSGNTLVWSGPAFGFGFYRAGEIHVSFVFDAKSKGLNDSVKLPRIRGQLIDATCSFTKDRVWFFTSSQEGGRTINRCAIIKRDGTVEATAEAEAGDGSWLSQFGGGFATGASFYQPTDDGIVKVDIANGAIAAATAFPDTEPFVGAGSKLFPHQDGIAVVDKQEITVLKIAP